MQKKQEHFTFCRALILFALQLESNWIRGIFEDSIEIVGRMEPAANDYITS